MEFDYVLKSRRSVRSFKEQKIPFDVLESVLEAARWAPCAGNIYNTKIIIVEDEEVKQEIASACLDQNWIAAAPVILVFCSNADAVESRYKVRGRLYQVQNTAAAVQNVMLAAADKGLATCWVGAFSDNQLKRALEIPDNVEAHAVVPIGIKNQVPIPVRKLHLRDILFWGKWDQDEKKEIKKVSEMISALKKKIKSKFRGEAEPEELGMESKPLKFYDLKGKQSFTTDNNKIVTKKVKGRKKRFAVAKAPSGIESWRVLPNN